MNVNATSLAYYEAEERWIEDHVDDAEDKLPAAAVPHFIDGVLSRSDFATPSRPTIKWDVSDGDEVSGRYDPIDDALHFHPRILRKSLVLHELAHWVDPRPSDGQGHGAVFLDVLAELVAVEFGDTAAEWLRRYVEDPEWLL